MSVQSPFSSGLTPPLPFNPSPYPPTGGAINYSGESPSTSGSHRMASLNSAVVVSVLLVVSVVMIGVLFRLYYFCFVPAASRSAQRPTRMFGIQVRRGAGGSLQHHSGLSMSEISTFATFTYADYLKEQQKREEGDELEGAAQECVVCFEVLAPTDIIRLLPPCQHVFHAPCIDQWFTQHTTCPLCRVSLLQTASPGKSGSSADVVTVIGMPQSEEGSAQATPSLSWQQLPQVAVQRVTLWFQRAMGWESAAGRSHRTVVEQGEHAVIVVVDAPGEAALGTSSSQHLPPSPGCDDTHRIQAPGAHPVGAVGGAVASVGEEQHSLPIAASKAHENMSPDGENGHEQSH